MKQYILVSINPEEDVGYLNATAIEFQFAEPNGIVIENDSGWCDASTGARILSKDDFIVFSPIDDEERLSLTLKFGDRLKELVA